LNNLKQSMVVFQKPRKPFERPLRPELSYAGAPAQATVASAMAHMSLSAPLVNPAAHNEFDRRAPRAPKSKQTRPSAPSQPFTQPLTQPNSQPGGPASAGFGSQQSERFAFTGLSQDSLPGDGELLLSQDAFTRANDHPLHAPQHAAAPGRGQPAGLSVTQGSLPPSQRTQY
jgi:hypothetical protein